MAKVTSKLYSVKRVYMDPPPQEYKSWQQHFPGEWLQVRIFSTSRTRIEGGSEEKVADKATGKYIWQIKGNIKFPSCNIVERNQRHGQL